MKRHFRTTSQWRRCTTAIERRLNGYGNDEVFNYYQKNSKFTLSGGRYSYLINIFFYLNGTSTSQDEGGNGFLTGRSGGHGREHPCAKDGTFLFVDSIRNYN